MKVLLVNSPWMNTRESYGVKAGARWAHLRNRRKTIPYYPFPFAMAYSTAVLKKNGFETQLIDAIASEYSIQETLQIIKTFRPDLVVIETSTPSIQHDLAFADLLNREYPVHQVFSGPHASALPVDVLTQAPSALAVLHGEYDETLLDLIQALDSGRDLMSVPGISVRLAQKIHRNPNRPLIQNIDLLPFPERDSLPMRRYTDPSCKKFPNASIITSRGCPNKCIFCLESTVFYHTPSLRLRNPESVVDEMDLVITRFNAQEIYFDDSSFTASPEHARAVSRAIIHRNLNISWSCMADARVDFETLKIMRDSGCIGLKFGVETADDGLMKAIHKQLDIKQVQRFVQDCKKLGLYTHGTFMFGLPGETRKSMEKTLAFAFSLKCTTSQFSVATPFPGTDFFELAKQNGWLVTDDWSRFDGAESPVIRYPDCSPDDIIACINQAKRKKIIHLATNPIVLGQYAWKLFKMKGFTGLVKELVSKLCFLLEKDNKPSHSCPDDDRM